MNRQTADPLLHGRLGRLRPIGPLALALLIGISLPGCLSARGLLAFHHRDPMAGAPRLKNAQNPRVEEVVAFLNQNTNRIQSWRSNSVGIRVDKWALSGTIAVEKDRHLRLVVTSMRGNEFDLGSNNERFWVWSRDMDPGFVTCKHENLEKARQQLGIPFEPDWLMQAFGVEPLPIDGFTIETDPTKEQARLVEHIVSAHGMRLRRSILVDLKKGIVLEHGLYNYEGAKMALAKLSDHRLDEKTGVVLPYRVTLEMPQNKMSMVMRLGDVQINPKSIPSLVWEMPQIRDCQVVHLDAGLPHGGITTAVRPESLDPLEGAGPIETIRSHDDHNFLREDFLREESDLADDDDDYAKDVGSTGRARLSSSRDELAPQDDIMDAPKTEEDWAK